MVHAFMLLARSVHVLVRAAATLQLAGVGFTLLAAVLGGVVGCNGSQADQPAPTAHEIDPSSGARVNRELHISLADSDLASGVLRFLDPVPAGCELEVTIHVRNSSDATIMSDSARPSCSCTEFTGTRVAPGQAGDWRVIVRTAGMVHRVRATVVIPAGAGAFPLTLEAELGKQHVLYAWKAGPGESERSIRLVVLAVGDSPDAPSRIRGRAEWDFASGVAVDGSTPNALVPSGELAQWTWQSDLELEIPPDARSGIFVVTCPGWTRALVRVDAVSDIRPLASVENKS
jgi:hypothetical protein